MRTTASCRRNSFLTTTSPSRKSRVISGGSNDSKARTSRNGNRCPVTPRSEKFILVIARSEATKQSLYASRLLHYVRNDGKSDVRNGGEDDVRNERWKRGFAMTLSSARETCRSFVIARSEATKQSLYASRLLHYVRNDSKSDGRNGGEDDGHNNGRREFVMRKLTTYNSNSTDFLKMNF